jgi:hypothetical protein
VSHKERSVPSSWAWAMFSRESLKRIDGRIVHPVGGNDFGREGRLQVLGFFGVQALAWNAALTAKVGEFSHIGFIIAFNGHEQTARVLDAVGGHPFQYFIFLMALFRRLGSVETYLPPL